jgi:hypothetical protein
MAMATGADDDVHVAGDVVTVLCRGMQHALRKAPRQRQVGTSGK